MTFRAGDIVWNARQGEKWVVAYERGGYLSWFGWPEGEVPSSECTLVDAATDEAHERALRQWAEPPHYRQSGGMDKRSAVCLEILHALLERQGRLTRIEVVSTITLKVVRVGWRHARHLTETPEGAYLIECFDRACKDPTHQGGSMMDSAVYLDRLARAGG